MKIKAGPIILFFIIYIFAWNIFNAVNARADESTLNCEAFVKEEICKMTPAEQEKWFWELFQSLIDEDLIKDKGEIEAMEICFKETEQGKLIPCKGMDI